MVHKPEGEHLITTFKLCDKEVLNDEERLKEILTKACILANCKVLKVVSHKFKPQGVTAMVLLEESHITIHTYPECKTAFVDIFTCGPNALPRKAMQYIDKHIDSKFMDIYRSIWRE